MSELVYLWIIIAGALGGLARALFGWASKDDPEPIDKTKVLKSIIRAVIGGAIFGFSAISTIPDAGLLAIIGTFFAAIGTDVLWHDVVKSIV